MKSDYNDFCHPPALSVTKTFQIRAWRFRRVEDLPCLIDGEENIDFIEQTRSDYNDFCHPPALPVTKTFPIRVYSQLQQLSPVSLRRRQLLVYSCCRLSFILISSKVLIRSADKTWRIYTYVKIRRSVCSSEKSRQKVWPTIRT